MFHGVRGASEEDGSEGEAGKKEKMKWWLSHVNKGQVEVEKLRFWYQTISFSIPYQLHFFIFSFDIFSKKIDKIQRGDGI